MEEKRYLLKHTDEIITPCLIYYKDIIEQNIKEMISVAGNANRLWPHVKSHKMKKKISGTADKNGNNKVQMRYYS